MIRRLFRDHPESIGETYPEHLRAAGRFGAILALGGIACMIHAIVPAWFETSGSGTVARLHDELVRKRAARRAANEEMRHGGWVI